MPTPAPDEPQDAGTGEPTPLRRDPVAHARLDGHAERLETVEDTVQALSRLPERVAEIGAVAKAAAENASATRQDVHALRSEAADLRREVSEHFARIHQAHADARKRAEDAPVPATAQVQAAMKKSWSDHLKDLAPIIVALIGAYVAVKTGVLPAGGGK